MGGETVGASGAVVKSIFSNPAIRFAAFLLVASLALPVWAQSGEGPTDELPLENGEGSPGEGPPPVLGPVLDVASMTITGFSFTLDPPALSPGYGTTSAFNRVIGADTNLVEGPKADVLTFDLTLDFGVRTEDWSATAFTTAASPATVNRDNGTFTIDLSTFTTDWDGERCPPAAFPSCTGIPWGPAGGTVTGTWDPMTGAFLVAWDELLAIHPFPDGTGNWTLQGVANPVPLPAPAVLFVSGAAVLAGVRRRAR